MEELGGEGREGKKGGGEGGRHSIGATDVVAPLLVSCLKPVCLPGMIIG